MQNPNRNLLGKVKSTSAFSTPTIAHALHTASTWEAMSMAKPAVTTSQTSEEKETLVWPPALPPSVCFSSFFFLPPQPPIQHSYGLELEHGRTPQRGKQSNKCSVGDGLQQKVITKCETTPSKEGKFHFVRTNGHVAGWQLMGRVLAQPNLPLPLPQVVVVAVKWAK